MEEFLRAYLVCMLWSSTGSNDEPLDADFDIDDISEKLMASSTAECKDFFESNRSRIELAIRNCGYTVEMAGHDFWLTRNGHGAGFWDRGLGAVGEKLTAAAKIYGGVDIYDGDDGKLYA